MKHPKFFTGFITSLVVFFSGQAFAQGSPEAFAKKFLDVASRADKEALGMLDETARKQYEQGFAEKAKNKWGVPPGYVSVSYPEILAETRRGDWALYVFRRELLAATDTAATEKKSYDTKIGNYFPEEQRPGAKKAIYWNGNTFETLVPVIVHRANDDKPWKILADPTSEAPLPSLHAALMRKFGCNLLRWTEGEAGRPLPLHGWIAGESPEPGTGDEKTDARCMKPETGAACGVGEKGCLDKQGNACTGAPEEQAPETGPHKGGLGKKP